ncbi:EVI5-like protein isoform 2-T3 [Salvelinus alpinus]
MRSMSGSRRNSGSSLVSSSSASSNLSHLEEDTWILWGRIVNEWDEWRRKKDKLLKELIRKGIPHHFRAIVWQLLGNATDMPVKNQYSELLKMSSPCEKLIRRDIARTYPEHEFFKGQDSLGQEVLFNVMKAYSLVDREVGYCQGSAFIVGLLLMQMPEEEAFCVFVRLMQEYRLRELFKPTMDELGLCIYQFEYLLQTSGGGLQVDAVDERLAAEQRLVPGVQLLCLVQPVPPGGGHLDPVGTYRQRVGRMETQEGQAAQGADP